MMEKKQFNIEIVNRQLSYHCFEDENLLKGLERRFGKDIMVGCRQGGCGLCRVQLLSGTVTLEPMSSSHISKEDRENGIVLACRTIPTSDIKLNYLGLKA